MAIDELIGGTESSNVHPFCCPSAKTLKCKYTERFGKEISFQCKMERLVEVTSDAATIANQQDSSVLQY
jgi:hypothetical protein